MRTPRYGLALLALTPAAALAAEPESGMKLSATGAQVYVCTASGTAAAWQLKGPEAILADAAGKVVGKHFAGPTWQSDDGSSVVGEVLASAASPEPGAVAWLVLKAKSHAGSGVMSDVTYVVRTNTRAGAPPKTGCDGAHAGSETKSAYSADYLFFRTHP